MPRIVTYSAADENAIVRGILGLINSGAIISFGRAVGSFYGNTAAVWYMALQATQFHLLYYMSRPLPNMFALPFSKSIICSTEHIGE